MKKRGLDFNGFLKVQEDDRSAVMQHPQGHRITIAKHSLTPELRKKLLKLPLHAADGTMTPVEAPEESMAPSPVPAPQPVVVNVNSAPTPAPMLAAPLPMPFPEASVSKNAQPVGSIEETVSVPREITDDKNPVPSLAPVSGVPSMASVPTGLQGPAIAPTPKSQPIAPAMGSNWAQQAIGAENQYAKTAQGEAALQAKIYENDANKQRELSDRFNERYNYFTTELSNIEHDLQNQKINPNRFVENQSVPQRIFTAIGLILGGIGSGLTGQENPAMKFLNSQIDRDIEAQKTKLQGNQDRYKNLLSRFHSEKELFDMMRLERLAAVDSQIKQSAARLGGAQSVLNAQRASAEIRAKMQPLMAGMAAERLLMENTDPSAQNQILSVIRTQDPKRAKELEALVVPFLGVAKTEKDATDAKVALEGYKNFTSMIDDIVKLRNEYGSEQFNRNAIARGKTLSTNLLLKYKELAKLGVLSVSDEELLNKIIPADPLQFEMTGSTLAQLGELRKRVDSDFQSFLTSRSLGGSQGGAPGKYVPQTFKPSP